MASGLLRVSLRVLGWIVFVLLAAGVVLCGIVALITVFSHSAWALFWGAATAISGAAAILLFRALRATRLELVAQRNGQPWDASIRAALAELPPNSDVRRSAAGRGGTMGILPLAAALWIIGLIAAVIIALATDESYPDHLDPGAAFTLIGASMAVTGISAGALLSIVRDRGGRSLAWWTAAVLPIGLGLLGILSPVPMTSAGEVAGRIVSGLTVVALTGICPVVGFLLARWLNRLRQPPNQPVLPADLAGAIGHGRADALLRHYPADEAGLAYLREDEALLSRSGYQKVAEDELDVSVAELLLGEAPRVAALFVRRSATT